MNHDMFGMDVLIFLFFFFFFFNIITLVFLVLHIDEIMYCIFFLPCEATNLIHPVNSCECFCAQINCVGFLPKLLADSRDAQVKV